MQRRMHVIRPEAQEETPESGATSHAVAPGRTYLPAQLTTFVGREAETAGIVALLRREGVRLLTLHGAPGAGKTRLAVHAASHLAGDFRDGVIFVDLASVRHPDSVGRAIAAALESVSDSHLPRGHEPFPFLKTLLASKNSLLLLDNFEQVVEAAPLLADLLAACMGVRVLVTSRSVLHVRGEYEFLVPALTLPDPSTSTNSTAVKQSEAIALFEQRAQAILPDFRITEANARAVAQVCSQLDGLPLAVELAAARIGLIPVEVMPAWLDNRLQFLGMSKRGRPLDLPERQQTLYDTIDWSYSLLDRGEQDLFRRLAVFKGGFTLEAAEALADDEGPARTEAGNAPPDTVDSRSMPGTTILDDAASLLDKGLLQQVGLVAGEPRLRMLATIQEYAWLQLVESGEVDVARKRHADFYCRLAERAEGGLLSAEQALWLAKLDAEQHNLAAALDWCEARCEANEDEALLALRICAALWLYWETRSAWGECRRLAGLLGNKATKERTATRARAFWTLARLYSTRGDDTSAEGPFQQSLDIFRELGNDLGTSRALMGLGQIAMRRCDFERAQLLLEESLSLRRKIGDGQLIAHGLAQLAAVEVHRGEYTVASELLSEALAWARATGDKWTMSNLLMAASWANLNLGYYDEAEASAGKALGLAIDLGSKSDMSACLYALSHCAYMRDDLLRSARLLGATDSVMAEIGMNFSGSDQWAYGSYTEELRTRLGAAAYAQLLQEGHSISPIEVAGAYHTNAINAEHSLLDGSAGDAGPWASAKRSPGKLSGSGSGAAAELPGGEPRRASTLWSEDPELAARATLEEAELTLRELEVLRLLSVGLTNKQIAERLTISRHTVNVHVKTIFSKLAVTSRSAATYFAVTNRLV